jgi:hypothetical protein
MLGSHWLDFPVWERFDLHVIKCFGSCFSDRSYEEDSRQKVQAKVPGSHDAI